MEYAVNIKNLGYHYPDGQKALEDINIDIPAGTRTAILGPNGAGKSTLLLHLNGIKTPSCGEILIMGKKIQQGNLRQIRKQVGLVFQDPDDQVFSSTVYEDVAFGPLNMKMQACEVKTKVRQALEMVNMQDLAHRSPNTLSYGQKKRAAIAGILVMEPDIIVLDEPAAYLDPAGKDALFEILGNLSSCGKTIITATHDVDLAAEWADNVIIMASGKVIAQGGRELLADEDIVRSANLRLPIVSKLFKEMAVEGRLPVTIDEALQRIKHGSY